MLVNYSFGYWEVFDPEAAILILGCSISVAKQRNSKSQQQETYLRRLN